MKTYGLYFSLLALTAFLVILAACGNGDIISLDSESDEYLKMNEAKENLTAEWGIITYCGEEVNKDEERCKEIYKTRTLSSEESSSSSEEPAEEPSSSSEELELSSSSEEPEPESSSSIIGFSPYDIPKFTCSWTPYYVESGENTQVSIKFDTPNEAADADCKKVAWLAVDIYNEGWGTPTGKYDTILFTLAQDYATSGKLTGTQEKGSTTWPAKGRFAINSTVSCVNASASKSPASVSQECKPLYIGELPTFTCASVTGNGTVGSAITQPAVVCNDTIVSASNISWANAPKWENPEAAGTYDNITATVKSGTCGGWDINCEGTLVVDNVVTCANVPSTGTAGTAIAPPAVTCNGIAVLSGGIEWAGNPSWSLPLKGTYSDIKATPNAGICSGMEASCGGTLTVNLPSFACGNVAQSITTEQIPTKPQVTCGGAVLTTIAWAPDINSALAAGSHSIKATANCGGESQTATCSGTITVTAPPSSSSVAPSSSSVAPSSSSAAPSSSSVAPSSSSATPSSSSVAPSSSSATPSSSSVAPSSSSATPSSSSIAPSSSSATPSSSSVAPSSSSATPTITCANVPSTGTVGTAITPPAVTCNGTAVLAANINWANAPTWSSPTAAGTYNSVKATPTTGTCNGMQISCGGILTVSNSLTCANVPSAGTVGTAITPPAVTCNGTAVLAANINWANAPTWSSPTAAGTYNSVKATPTTGTCNGMQISCGGTLTVSLPSFTCGSVAQSITTTQIPNKPAVTCGGTTVTAANITWSPNINNVLAAGSHTVKATASCGLTDQTATCSGTITVTAPSSSSVAPSSSSLAPSSSSLAPSSSSLAPSSSSLAPSSSSLAPSSSSLAPSSSSLAPSSSSAAQPISITSTETSIPAGTHSITCSGGGQLVCRTLDGTKKTFTINDAECTAFEQMGWGSCGSGSCKASTSTIVTPASISCAGMW